MNNDELKNRIKELELELNNLKSGGVATNSTANHTPEESIVKFLTLANYIPAYIAYVNADTLRYEFVNDMYEKSFGIPKEKIIGSHIKDVIGEKNYKFALKYIKEVKSGKVVSYENIFNLSSGKRWLQVNYSPVFGDNSKVVGIALVNHDITEQKQMEITLEKSKKTAENYLNVAAELILSIDVLGNIVMLNDSGHKLLGYNQGELIGKNWFKTCLPEEISSEVLNVFEKLMNGDIRNTENYENTVKTKSGEIKTLLWHNALVKDFDGNVTGTISSGNDITESKTKEEILRDSEGLYRRLFNEDLAGNFVSTIDGQLLQCNTAYADIMGFESADEMLKASTQTFYKNPDDRNEIIKRIKENKKLTNHEYQMIKKDGKEISVIGNISGKFDKTDNLIQLSGFLLDITKIKQVELELIESKEKAEENEVKFRNLFEHSPIGKSMTGIDGSIHVNKSFCEIVGYSEGELYGKKWKEISYPEDIPRTNEKLQSLLNGEAEKVFFEKRYIHKNGNIVWADLSTYLQRDKENKPEYYISTVVDITARKRYEKDLIEAKEKAEESDHLKSAFLTNMSHEIRTPLNGILGFAELLKEPNLTSDDQQDYLQTMQISGARMLNTINSIVDISKIESGLMKVDIKETNLNEKIEFTYKFFRPETEKKGLRFLYKNGLPSKDAIIKTDNEKVYGVLTNLIKNAIKFTYDGSIEFGYEKKGEYLEFYVKDTGIGIPKNQQEIIFERFRQGSESYNRGYEGSGLGLSIAKSYVEMLGGKIWLESDEMKGSTFYFIIPYDAVSEEAIEIISAVPAEHKKVQLKNLKILIVEDDEISYSLLAKTIQKISKEVLHAITGVEAVETCRNNPDLDLILMDIRMPIMDGNEATRQIRQFNKDVIIIAQTAYAFAGDSEKAIGAGCNDYISKSVNLTLLFELIKKHVK